MMISRIHLLLILFLACVITISDSYGPHKYTPTNPFSNYTNQVNNQGSTTHLSAQYAINNLHQSPPDNQRRHESPQPVESQRRQDHPPPVEAQPFTPPQHDNHNFLYQNEDPAIAKPFETQSKNPSNTNSNNLVNDKLPVAPPMQSPRVPLYMYNPSLARRLGISTFMMGSVLYGLSILPALLAAGVGAGVGPFAGIMSSIGKRKRRRRSLSMFNYQEPNSIFTYQEQFLKQLIAKNDSKDENLPNLSNLKSIPEIMIIKRSPGPYVPSTMAWRYRELPLLDHRSTHRFLSLLEMTLDVRKISDDSCRKNFLCNIYKSALDISDKPTLSDFEIAIIDTLGIAAERTGMKVDVISMVKFYLDSALVGMTPGGSCTKVFPCIQSTTFFRFFPQVAALAAPSPTQQTPSRDEEQLQNPVKAIRLN